MYDENQVKFSTIFVIIAMYLFQMLFFKLCVSKLTSALTVDIQTTFRLFLILMQEKVLFHL